MKNKIILMVLGFSLLNLGAVIYLNRYYFTLNFSLILLIITFYDVLQKQRTLMSNYPIVGRFRYWMEVLRPKIYQYFIESDTDGRPISRIFRSVVYQRSKRQTDTVPFGTQLDVYESGYEWMNHSMNPVNPEDIKSDLDVKFGSKFCQKPYTCSRLNISAMSYGSLSKNAILALNGGARLGGFAHNTGEGGISEFHLEKGGDLIWQIGTGYFGCRDENGKFDVNKFSEKASIEQVKMIEIKVSQGAKPGHGGILPAIKNTDEIARIRGVRPHQTIYSPSGHTAYKCFEGMLDFIETLRESSGGKPIGIKMCVGNNEEVKKLINLMEKKDQYPDYIAVDGGEGGTGAAPAEFSNSLGTPLREGLAFVSGLLRSNGLKSDIKLMASGKVITGFHMARLLALGADTCYSARAFMLSLGCIQALECNTNHCPVGVATQDKNLYSGLNVIAKEQRVYHFHHNTIHALIELLGAAGVRTPEELSLENIYRRISPVKVMSYKEIYGKQFNLV